MLIRPGNRVRVVSAPRRGQKSPEGIVGVVTAEARNVGGGMTYWIQDESKPDSTETAAVFVPPDEVERFWG